jgi:hypothetical protein
LRVVSIGQAGRSMTSTTVRFVRNAIAYQLDSVDDLQPGTYGASV